ncbi:NAD-dependent epimerase/dehydratase [Candidatus Sulfotelmatobacter kueseliae]|uniref:NAD-dependent epimerase/dehydratase n=1 Tax=Candidatus Sulfotelmatobacter kueseliae TaxID=2042962 RepID=A0A2U3K975_9BACT|nr:NAD-dependent epimerase/dehydratase [Candidatus Sulfotelmatobacter kueseliae]
MAKPVVVVTGISGNLGSRLLPLLGSYSVIGVDMAPPQTDSELRFERLDLGQESSTRAMYELLRDTHACAVVHLAFVIDPVRTGVLDLERMWQINVAGTARVMEAVTEANRTTDDGVKQFIFPSSVSAYGPNLPGAVTEESPLAAHTLPYAIHKKESDEVVQQRSPALRGCSSYILRPHIFAGASVENYLMGAFHGTPDGKGARAEKMRREGKRLPCMLPRGQQYLDNKIQFIHVDDMARVIRHILQREPETQRLTVLNVAGRGEPLTFGRCVEMARAKLIRVPGKWAMRQVLKFLWWQQISAIPPEAVPYMSGQYIMNTERLRRFLGPEYEDVIRYTIADAFADSFRNNATSK